MQDTTTPYSQHETKPTFHRLKRKPLILFNILYLFIRSHRYG